MMKMNNRELLDQFRDYLEKTEEAQREVPRKLSLLTFYEELISLKNEIRIESRIVKQGLDDFQKTAELIEQGNRKMDILVEKSDTGSENAPSLVEKQVVQGLLDLYDGAQASLQTIRKSRKATSWLQRLRCGENQQILRSVHEGQKMTLDRALELLRLYGAVPMEVVGRRFDPHTMRAVGTDSLSGLEDGVVSNESRTGFTLHGDILRPADVRVNRLQGPDGKTITEKRSE